MTGAARILLLALGLLAGLCAGCATRLDPPSGWVELEVHGDTQVDAIASAGHRLAVRRYANETGGTLAFWADAIRRELVDGRGYRLVESADVTTEGGLTGREMLLEADVALVPHTYLVAVFVAPGNLLALRGAKVVVVEAAGVASTLRDELPALRAAVRSLR